MEGDILNYALIYDILLVAVILISAFVMSGKGLFKILYKATSIIVTVLVVVSCSNNVSELISDSPIGRNIATSVEMHILSDDTVEESQNIDVMPEYINKMVTDIKTNTVAPAVTGVIINVISAICIYIAVKILLYILFFFIKGVFKLPLLKQASRLAGVCVGIISGMIIVYMICAIISLNIANSDEIRMVIDNTYLVKYFYDNNLLMTLII